MNKIVRLIGIVICLIFCGNSEGMTLPQQFTLSKSIEGHQSELSQSKVFIAVTVHNQIPFISNLRKTLEANVTELARAGVQSHVLITCDGIQEDYEECKKQFKDFPLFTTESLDIRFQKRNDKVVEIGWNLFNDYMRSSAEYFNFSPTEEELFKHDLESMVSISLTRWNQLNHINELMKEAKKSDLSPYLFMFDGDDIMHKDLILIELLSLLETGADAASPGDYFGMNSDEKASSGNILRCTYENSSEILERASLDIDKYFVTKAPYFEGFAFNLFDGIVLEKVMEEGYKFGSDRFKKPIYPEMDFATLTPFIDALTNIVNVYLLDIPEEEKYQKTKITCGPMSAPFFSKGNKQNTLFYYMQHDDSLQGQMRKFDK